MAKKRGVGRARSADVESQTGIATGTEQLLLAALERGGDTLETGRYLISYREGMVEEGLKSFKASSLRMADARDFSDQAAAPQDAGDADGMVFPEIGVALVSGGALQSMGLSALDVPASEGAVEVIEPEYFVFAESSEYMRGFTAATNAIARDLGLTRGVAEVEEEVDAEVLGATWGLNRCKVPPSMRSGLGIKVAVLDTGMDLGHPDFAGRPVTSQTFCGQPVQDLNGHGTHCIGTACGPKAPPGTTPRYGIAFASRIFAGKVLTNSGSGTGGGRPGGHELGHRQSLRSDFDVARQSKPRAAGVYERRQCGSRQGVPDRGSGRKCVVEYRGAANSPSIFSVASLDPNLQPSSFSNFGKIEIAAPGRDVFSAWPRPTRYRTISGTSMATPHVAGCAALWAQTSASLRGIHLWRRLQSSARRLPLPASKVGAGLVQAP